MIEALLEARAETGAWPSGDAWEAATAKHPARRTYVRLFRIVGGSYRSGGGSHSTMRGGWHQVTRSPQWLAEQRQLCFNSSSDLPCAGQSLPGRARPGQLLMEGRGFEH